MPEYKDIETKSTPMTRPYTVERNIVYGMVSGTAMLGDLYRPQQPNGIGLIHISGSGWQAPTTYDARPLKESPHVEIYVYPLAARGFTVFTINHRAIPTFRYPDPLHDAQRAMRFFRHNADNFGIDPDHIGAIGGSSGGHLVSLLGVLDGSGNAQSEDPVERESAKVQCVATRAAPFDLMGRAANERVAILMGRVPDPSLVVDSLYHEASPITHVDTQTPPFLLFHGTADDVVPFDQSIQMQEVLVAQGIPVSLITVEGAGHGPGMPGAVNPPDLIGEIAAWFDCYLDSA